jgi:hypothetical protein
MFVSPRPIPFTGARTNAMRGNVCDSLIARNGCDAEKSLIRNRAPQRDARINEE